MGESFRAHSMWLRGMFVAMTFIVFAGLAGILLESSMGRRPRVHEEAPVPGLSPAKAPPAPEVTYEPWELVSV